MGDDMTTAGVEQARFNMIEQQIRTWEVLDQSVLDLLFQVRREEFVPTAYRGLAFADLEIPLGPAPGQQWKYAGHHVKWVHQYTEADP